MRYNGSMPAQMLPLSVASGNLFSADIIVQLVPLLLAAGWLMLVFMLLWIIWNTYLLLKRIDYFSAIQWTFLEVTIPPDSEETPKSMEIFYEVIGGMHKEPDMTEKYFDGYVEAWISCEIMCTPGQARYFIVTPTAHRQLVEGTLYAHYPRAEIREAEDYTQRYNWRGIRQTFDVWGTEIILSEDDIYPIRTYIEYETKLAEEDKYVDPHQAIVEAFTNISPGEEYWIQLLVRPVAGKTIKEWAKRGHEQVSKISGQAKEKPATIRSRFLDWMLAFPTDFMSALLKGGAEVDMKDEKPTLRFFNPVDEARMKGILQKTSHTGFATKLRVVHIAPVGQLKKPNIGRGIGVFKQFNTFHLNGLRPDPKSKSNGPNYILREPRRYLRERKVFLQYYWREIWYGDGKMFTPEELATLFHLPSKHVKAPGLARAKSGLHSPPQNLPYAG